MTLKITKNHKFSYEESNNNFNSLRDNIADKHFKLNPDILNYKENTNRFKYDYTPIINNFSSSSFRDKFHILSHLIVDLRNTFKPTTFTSNTVAKTDNRYANETKDLIKVLLSKGKTVNEVTMELEDIYGSGIIAQDWNLDRYSRKQLFIYFFTMFSFWSGILFIGFKINRFRKRFKTIYKTK